jgi:hypothetical protein
LLGFFLPQTQFPLRWNSTFISFAVWKTIGIIMDSLLIYRLDCNFIMKGWWRVRSPERHCVCTIMKNLNQKGWRSSAKSSSNPLMDIIGLRQTELPKFL